MAGFDREREIGRVRNGESAVVVSIWETIGGEHMVRMSDGFAEMDIEPDRADEVANLLRKAQQAVYQEE